MQLSDEHKQKSKKETSTMFDGKLQRTCQTAEILITDFTYWDGIDFAAT